jgi:hypothetical protein
LTGFGIEVRRELRHDVLFLRGEPLLAQRVPVLHTHRCHDAAFEFDQGILNRIRGQTFQLALEQIPFTQAIEGREVLMVETGKGRSWNVGCDWNGGGEVFEGLEAGLGFLELLEEILGGRLGFGIDRSILIFGAGSIFVLR